MRYLKKFNTIDDFYSTSEVAYPAVLLIGSELKYYKEYEPVPDVDSPLYIEALEDLTVSFSTNAIQYSLDNSEWLDLAAATATPTINAGSKVFFRASGLTASSSYGIGQFTITGSCNVGGNVMSMLYGADYAGQVTISQSYALYNLFRDADTIKSAFRLALPATTMASYCYNGMFLRCTSLVNAPALPAMALISYCYSNMFAGCTSLVNAPALPATTMDSYCYNSMFSSCTSLVNAPALPATALASYCYQNMFKGCTSLVNAPALPATTLVERCYQYMFQNCTKLVFIKAMFTTSPSISYMKTWVSGVAASGTFVKNSAATWTNSFGESAIPTGWTVETADA